MEKCYVLFGSNLGDKSAIFEHACALIINRCGRIVGVSSEYESEPWGFEADEWFLNRLIIVETELGPEELIAQLLDIEDELGRVRYPEVEGYISRTIDLDILYFGNRVMQTERVIVPHPRLHLRRFALLPLCELVPNMLHPILQLTQKELLECCPDEAKVIKVEVPEKQIHD